MEIYLKIAKDAIKFYYLRFVNVILERLLFLRYGDMIIKFCLCGFVILLKAHMSRSHYASIIE